MPPKRRTTEIEKSITNASKKSTSQKSVVISVAIHEDLPKIPEEEITTEDPKMKLLQEALKSSLRATSAKLHHKTNISVHDGVKDHESKVITKHGENCDNLSEYFSPLLLKGDLDRRNFAKLTNTIKSITGRTHDDILNGKLIVSPETVNLIEVNHKMKVGFEEDVKVRTKVENQSTMRKDKNSDLGFKREAFVSNFTKSRTRKTDCPAIKNAGSVYTELNYISSSLPDKEIARVKSEYLNSKAERFSKNMFMDSRLRRIRYENTYRSQLIKQKELEQSEKLREEEELKEKQQGHHEQVKIRVQESEEQKVMDKKCAEDWKSDYALSCKKYMSTEQLECRKKLKEIIPLTVQKSDNINYLERRNLRENGRISIKDQKEHSKKYLSNKSSLTLAKSHELSIEKERSKMRANQLKEQLSRWDRNDNGNNVTENDEATADKKELRLRAKVYSNTIAETHQERYEVDPEKPGFKTDHIKKQEEKQEYLDQIEEKQQRHAEDGKNYFETSKKLGSKITNEKNKAKRELEIKALNSAPTTPAKITTLSSSIVKINGQGFPDYLTELSRHKDNKVKDIEYWQNKINGMTKLSQNELDNIVRDILLYDKKTQQLKDLVDTKANAKAVLNNYNVKKAEDLNEIVDNMHFRSIEAKLMLMNKGTEYIPGYNSKMNESKSNSLLNRIHYKPQRQALGIKT